MSLSCASERCAASWRACANPYQGTRLGRTSRWASSPGGGSPGTSRSPASAQVSTSTFRLGSRGSSEPDE